MIISGLLAILQFFIASFLKILPVWDSPTMSPAWSALSAANIVLPLDVWASLSGATVVVMGAGLSFWAAKMAFNMIRGSGA